MRAERIEWLRKEYPKGTRLKLYSMEGESQMPSGLEGSIFCVDDIGQIHVNWDNGSTLAVNVEKDRFIKLNNPEQEIDEHSVQM